MSAEDKIANDLRNLKSALILLDDRWIIFYKIIACYSLLRQMGDRGG
jgi:hypothetical protein